MAERTSRFPLPHRIACVTSAADRPKVLPAASRRGQRAEQAIVQAVLDLLDNDEVSSLTMDKIAARARVGKPTIYRRWSNKSELVAHALNSLVAGPPLTEAGDLRETLVLALTDLRDRLSDTKHGRAWRKLLGSQDEYREALDLYRRRYLLPRREELVAAVRRHHPEHPAGIEPDVLVQVVSNAMLGALMMPGDDPGAAADPAVIVDTFLASLRSR